MSDRIIDALMSLGHLRLDVKMVMTVREFLCADCRTRLVALYLLKYKYDMRKLTQCD